MIVAQQRSKLLGWRESGCRERALFRFEFQEEEESGGSSRLYNEYEYQAQGDLLIRCCRNS